MAEERNYKKKPATVTVGLTDGRTLIGRINYFHPAEPEFGMVVIARGTSGRSSESTERLVASDVAYIAVHIGSALPPAAPSGKRRTLDIHVAGGLTFTVSAPEEKVADRLGFWASPTVASSGFSEIFFYAHGINAREDKVTLGALLVETGVLEGLELTRGLEEQAASRSINIGDILIQQNKVPEEMIAVAAVAQREAASKGKYLRLGEVLVEAGLASEEDIQVALEEQKKRRGKRIGEVLVDMGLLSEFELAKALSHKFNVPFIDLDQTEVNPQSFPLVPPDLVRKYGMLPIQFDGTTLSIAISDPLAFEGLDLLRFSSKFRIVESVAMPSQVAALIRKMSAMDDGPSRADRMEEILADIHLESETDGDADGRDQAAFKDDSTMARLVNQIIYDAQLRNVSDIHIEPNGEDRETIVRFRVDGVCEVYRKFQPAIRSRLVARLKIMANLDITERRKPQDGKIRLKLNKKPLELRVATIPTSTRDEDVVLRILSAGEPITIEKLLLSPRNLAETRRIIQKPYGMFLAVGPTGSGKTTTLHSIIGVINTPERKIWTAEDPVEITQRGLRQVQMHPKIGLDFASALRSFLRADPDVIMVGEMRDHETAAMGVEASLTGHLVFSTLHTNTAPETVTRLVDMGVDPFTFSDALLGILGQRLARRLCIGCREQYEATEKERKELELHYGRDEMEETLDGRPLMLSRAPGCPKCNGRGYIGRLGLHELLVNEDDIRSAIQKKAPISKIRSLAVAGGMRTLLQDGIDKCLSGLTDFRQVLAVCSR